MIKEKIARLKEMSRLEVLDADANTPDQQISLTDPDARWVATSGRGSGILGYNVQAAADTEHHPIVTQEVINVGNDRGQLALMMSKQAKEVLEVDKLEAVAWRLLRRRGDISLREAGVAVTLPKPITSNGQGGGPVRQAGSRLPA
ncbi:hypothetical protein ACNJX9_35325 [Bradyrhizobium sp. DASA03076]|uniref:hypothetical protein n=1 Tax=Bradyrhizobium sp. BLXBL-03 TaxID=3395916 RepID=UPI003F72D391